MKVPGYHIIRTIVGDEKMRDNYIFLTERANKYFVTRIENSSPCHLDVTHQKISENEKNELATAKNVMEKLVELNLYF